MCLWEVASSSSSNLYMGNAIDKSRPTGGGIKK
jgi:hypothetical protein